jgi:hypothetical protein
MYANACQFRTNDATANPNGVLSKAAGEGIYSDFSSVVLTNSVLDNNQSSDDTASSGGTAVYAVGETANRLIGIINCTITRNSSDSSLPNHAGGVFLQNVTARIANCILWQNSALDIANSGSALTVTYSNFQGGPAGTGNINQTPRFVNQSNGNLRLTAESPCIDAGRNTNLSEYGFVVTDIEGVPRGFNGSGEVRGDGSDYDMGAYEFTGR